MLCERNTLFDVIQLQSWRTTMLSGKSSRRTITATIVRVVGMKLATALKLQ